MFGDYLTLHLARLVGAEKWQGGEDGFHFIFFRGGMGLLVSNSASHPVSQGDVLILNAERGGKIVANDSGELLFSHFSVRLENLYPLFSATELSLLQSLATELSRFKIYPASSALALECQQLVGVAPSHFDLNHRSHLLRIAASILSEEFKSL